MAVIQTLLTDLLQTFIANQNSNNNFLNTTKAPLASPAITGIPTAPTASAGTNNTQLATTGFLERLLIGTIHPFAGTTPNAGTLLCDGTAYSRTTYANLFAVIGTTWGVGDGSTTFNVPNGKGKTLIGAGLAASGTTFTLGVSGGEEKHTLTNLELPANTVDIKVKDDGSIVSGHIQLGTTGNTHSFGAGGGAIGITENMGQGVSHNNLQPYAVVNYIIVY